MLSEAGSGTAAFTLLRLIVRLKLHGAAAVHPAGAVMVYKSVTENGLGSFAPSMKLSGSGLTHDDSECGPFGDEPAVPSTVAASIWAFLFASCLACHSSEPGAQWVLSGSGSRC